MQTPTESPTRNSLALDEARRLEAYLLERRRQCWKIGSCFGASLLGFVLVFALPQVFGVAPNVKLLAPLGLVPISLFLWLLISVLTCTRTHARLERIAGGIESFPLTPVVVGEHFGSQRVSRLDHLGIEFEHRLSPAIQLALKWTAGVLAAIIGSALIANMTGILAHSQPTGVFKLLITISLFLGVWALFPTPCRCSLARPSPSSDFILTWTDASILHQVRHVEVRFDGYSKVEIGPVGRHLFVKIDDGRLESIVSVANTPLSSWHLTRIELALLEVLGQDTPEDEDDEKEDDEA